MSQKNKSGRPRKDRDRKTARLYIVLSPMQKRFVKRAAEARSIPMTALVVMSLFERCEKILGEAFQAFSEEQIHRDKFEAPKL